MRAKRRVFFVRKKHAFLLDCVNLKQQFNTQVLKSLEFVMQYTPFSRRINYLCNTLAIWNNNGTRKVSFHNDESSLQFTKYHYFTHACMYIYIHICKHMHNTACINNSKKNAWSITLRKSTELEQFPSLETLIIISQQPYLEKIVSDT